MDGIQVLILRNCDRFPPLSGSSAPMASNGAPASAPVSSNASPNATPRRPPASTTAQAVRCRRLRHAALCMCVFVQIAEQFSHQYYTVFSNYPRYLHRFYDQVSVQNIVEVAENGAVHEETATNPKVERVAAKERTDA